MDKIMIRRARVVLKLWGDADKLIRYNWECMSDARTALEEVLPTYRALTLDGMPHGTAIGRPVETTAIQLMEYERQFADSIRRYQDTITKLANFKKAVNWLVSTLPTVERDLIVRVYRDHMSIKSAATLAGYSERTGYNREISAIDRIGRRLLAWDDIRETA